MPNPLPIPSGIQISCSTDTSQKNSKSVLRFEGSDPGQGNSKNFLPGLYGTVAFSGLSRICTRERACSIKPRDCDRVSIALQELWFAPGNHAPLKLESQHSFQFC